MAARDPRPAPLGSTPFTITAALCALALAAWIAGHPFFGVVHDNRLYALQALRYNDPATFGGDLFFKYGSQDSFTIFSPFYAGLIRLLGLDMATKLLVIFGQALWVASAIALIRALVPRPFTWIALLLLATAPAAYGGTALFAIGEGFATPRLFSEALSLAAFACFLNGRGRAAAALLVGAALLHPLMAAAPAGILLTMRLFRGRVWWSPVPFIAAAALLLIAVLAFGSSAGLPVARIDPDWKFIATTRSPQLLVGSWSAADWMAYAACTMMVLLASFTAKPVIRQLLVTAAAAGAACVLVSFAGFDLLDSLHLGQLQIWRAVWVLRVLAPTGLALVIADACSRPHSERTLLLALCVSAGLFGALTASAGMASRELPLAVLIALVALTGRSGEGDAGRQRIVQACGWLSLALMWALSLSQIVTHVASTGLLSSAGEGPSPVSSLAGMFLPAALLLAGVLVFGTGRRGGHAALVPLALLAVPAAAANWDQRDQWQRFMDSGPDISAELETPIAPHDTVYWPGNIMGAWAPIGRESFYSPAQGSGMIFSRQTAMGFLERLRRVQAFEPAKPWQVALLGAGARGAGQGANDSGQAEAGLDDLLALCAGSSRPDVIILDRSIPGVRQERWTSPVAMPQTARSQPDGRTIADGRRITDFFFYRCKEMTPHASQP